MRHRRDSRNPKPNRGEKILLVVVPLVAVVVSAVLATATVIQDDTYADEDWAENSFEAQLADILPLQTPEQPIRLVFLGDVSISRRITEGLVQDPPTEDYLLGIRQLALSADALFVNLECVLADDDLPPADKSPLGGTFHLMGKSSSARELANAGVRLVSLANNHTMDYGAEGLIQTISALDSAGILHAGAGNNLEQARQPAILEILGTKIALLAYSNILHGAGCAGEDKPGAVLFKKEWVLEDIERTRPNCDLLVVSLHWLGEDQSKPDVREKSWAHSFIDAGADLIIGHHSHVLATVELYSPGIIAYSLGNSVFDTIYEHRRKSSALVVEFQKGEGITSFELVPIVIENLVTKVSDDADMVEFVQSKIVSETPIPTSP